MHVHIYVYFSGNFENLLISSSFLLFSLCLIVVTSSDLTRKSIIRTCQDSRKPSFAQHVGIKTY